MFVADASWALSRHSDLKRQERKKRSGEARVSKQKSSWKYLKRQMASPLERARNEFWHEFELE